MFSQNLKTLGKTYMDWEYIQFLKKKTWKIEVCPFFPSFLYFFSVFFPEPDLETGNFKENNLKKFYSFPFSRNSITSISLQTAA